MREHRNDSQSFTLVQWCADGIVLMEYRTIVVLYDGRCSMCRFSGRVVRSLDWLQQMWWIPFQSPEAERFGIPLDVLENTMCAVGGKRYWFGFAAWKQVLLRLPISYLLIGASAFVSPWVLPLWVAFFIPLTSPIGERVYQWVARNRHRVPGATCRLDS